MAASGGHHGCAEEPADDPEQARLLRCTPDPDSEDVKEIAAPIPNEGFDEDMFGMMACSLIRDFYFLSHTSKSLSSRVSRCATTFALLAICISSQVFLLLKIKQFVSSKAVHDIRIAYDDYEAIMYNETALTVNGKHRGVDGAFMPDRFHSLTADQQSAACRIPLSQPDFFFCVLLIWALTCVGEIKLLSHFFIQMFTRVETCASMKEVRHVAEDDEDGEHEFVIKALPMWLKMVLFFFVILPRACITIFLLWVGCRWLLATNNFADLLLNAVALEFVLLLKEMLYTILVPHRNKIDLGATFIRTETKETASVRSFTQTMLWFLVACAWVLSYIGIPRVCNGWQMVLPDYRWDLHDVCVPWVKWRYCVTPPCPDSF